MNKNLCQQYIKNIKSLFPIMGKSEKKYLQQLSVEIEDCLENEKPQRLEELYEKFGTPNDIVHNYFRVLEPDTIIKRVRINQWIKRSIITLLFIFLFASLIWGYTTYQTYKVFSEEQVFFEDTVIK